MLGPCDKESGLAKETLPVGAERKEGSLKSGHLKPSDWIRCQGKTLNTCFCSFIPQLTVLIPWHQSIYFLKIFFDVDYF